MASTRPTQAELRAIKQATRREEIGQAIADGRLKVRQMTAEERAQADRDRTRVRAAHAAKRHR